MKTTITPGDIITLGPHTLICGDATTPDLLAPILKNHPIEAIITDPPYGIAAVESSKTLTDRHKKIKNDHLQSDAEYAAFTRGWVEVVKPYLSEKNSFYIFNADPMIFALRQAMVELDFTVKQLLIWAKTSHTFNRLDYLTQHELILYGWHGKKSFRKAKDKSIIVCPKTKKNKLHPTMKPIKLLRRIILNSTKLGDTIYDPFGGSGSTLIAAEQTKRKCIMVELDPEYCQVIVNRYQSLKSKP